MTLRKFSIGIESIPIATSWYLAELGEALGKQELFTKQSPQKMKILREHTLIESTISSNRIEGVTVDQSRIHTLVFGKPKLRDRSEEEVVPLSRGISKGIISFRPVSFSRASQITPESGRSYPREVSGHCSHL
jgi:hypothetical protein